MPLFPSTIRRRDFLRSAVVPLLPVQAPAIVPADRSRPLITHGIQSADVSTDRATVWARTDRTARMIVEYAGDERFASPVRLRGPVATSATDFTAQLDLSGLPGGRPVFYRIWFESDGNPPATSEPQTGSFRTAPVTDRRVRLAWSADTVGQGWGINQAFGGLRLYETMGRQDPDLFVHSGDQIYADAPLPERVPLADGTVWTNLVTPAKSRIAETLDDYRGNFAYNRLDAHALRFSASVPLVAQWDDHEVTNNWYPDERLADERYTERRVSLLAERARQAMSEWVPRRGGSGSRIYRRIGYGPALELFVLDCRSHRAANGPNLEGVRTPRTAMLGNAQLGWLEDALEQSPATWKVIANDMPIGLVVEDGVIGGVPHFEGWANSNDGPALGRELELARILSHIKRRGIQNVVWITGDVHYAAAHYYDPARARFTDFLPFWEFVAGPMHAGTFGPGRLDATFGPEAKFVSVPDGMPQNRPPSDGLQFFGTLDCDAKRLTATIWNLAGEKLWSTELEAM